MSRSAVYLVHKGSSRRRTDNWRTNPPASFSKRRMLSQPECERPVICDASVQNNKIPAPERLRTRTQGVQRRSRGHQCLKKQENIMPIGGTPAANASGNPSHPSGPQCSTNRSRKKPRTQKRRRSGFTRRNSQRLFLRPGHPKQRRTPVSGREAPHRFGWFNPGAKAQRGTHLGSRGRNAQTLPHGQHEAQSSKGAAPDSALALAVPRRAEAGRSSSAIRTPASSKRHGHRRREDAHPRGCAATRPALDSPLLRLGHPKRNRNRTQPRALRPERKDPHLQDQTR